MEACFRNVAADFNIKFMVIRRYSVYHYLISIRQDSVLEQQFNLFGKICDYKFCRQTKTFTFKCRYLCLDLMDHANRVSNHQENMSV